MCENWAWRRWNLVMFQQINSAMLPPTSFYTPITFLHVQIQSHIWTLIPPLISPVAILWILDLLHLPSVSHPCCQDLSSNRLYPFYSPTSLSGAALCWWTLDSTDKEKLLRRSLYLWPLLAHHSLFLQLKLVVYFDSSTVHGQCYTSFKCII